MSIGSRIKELRERNGLSRNELATMLGVTVGAISNYENDVSSPKEPILFKIIEGLNCDAIYLFQDSVKITTQQNDVTLAEYDHIKKYRDLDDHGREMVDFTLTKEWERSTAEKKAGKVIPLAAPAASALDPNAAHAISGASAADQKHDDDIMDDENF